MEYTVFLYSILRNGFAIEAVNNMGLEQYLIDILPPKDPITITCEQITTRLNSILRQHLHYSYYDSIGFFSERLRHKTADSYAVFQRYSSGNCIGLTLGLLHEILSALGGGKWATIMRLPPFYVIPATLPAHYGGDANVFGHVALLAVCSNGLILLDSGFHIPQPIVLKNTEEVSLIVGEKTWRFRLQLPEKRNGVLIPGKISASVETKKFGKEAFEYQLRHISNPDEIVLHAHIKKTRRISYVQRNMDGIQINHVTLDFNTQKIQMVRSSRYLGNPFVSSVNFSDIDSGMMDVVLSLSGCPPTLIEQIKFIIASHHEPSRALCI